MEELGIMDDSTCMLLWQDVVPDSILFKIFGYLDLTELGRAASVCMSWRRVAMDDFLWHSLAEKLWSIKCPLASGKRCWRDEVKRLTYHVPDQETETLVQHTDEVLDVCISHNGQFFCTTSKDKLVVMWKLDVPSFVIAVVDTGTLLGWELTQYSCFNEDDSLVYVCGCRSLTPEIIDTDGSTGCGAVFTVPDMKLVALGKLDPPTLFGSWLTDRIFMGGGIGDIGGTMKILTYKVKEERINQSTERREIIQHVPSPVTLFKYLGDRYHQMNLLVAMVPQNERVTSLPFETNERCNVCQKQQFDLIDNHQTKDMTTDEVLQTEMSNTATRNSRFLCMCFNNSNCNTGSANIPEREKQSCFLYESIDNKDRDTKRRKKESSDVNCIEPKEQYLKENCKLYILFSTGHHDTIGVYEVTDEKLAKIDKAFCDIEAGQQKTDNSDLDDFDYSFVMTGCYITGVCLSHDHRYAYFNYREVVESSVGDWMEDKNFSGEIKTGVLDLVTMTIVKDTVYKGHVGTSAFPPWYICLDASKDYIGSGSEDQRGYIWDRHYNILLATLPHSYGVINGIAFSPTDQETCITVCDDMTIKIWQSKNRLKMSKSVPEVC